jgi:energy-coupling factor transporter ATP-binding protein EcfA2
MRRNRLTAEQKESPYPVFFARQPPDRPIAAPAVLIVPAKNSWNDFGLQTTVDFTLFPANQESFTGQMRLAFVGESNEPHGVIDAVLTKLRRFMASPEQFPKFFSLQFDIENYRKIVRRFGPEEAERWLVSMNDLVAARRMSPTPDWYADATSSDAFLFSFTRNAEGFFAFNHADSLLDGLESESIDNISTRLELNFKLPSFEQPHSLALSFELDSILPKQIAVFIGPNGTGKSQALNALASSLLSDDARLRAEDGRRPVIGRLIAIGTPGETDRTFPRERKHAKIRYVRLGLKRARGGVNSRGLSGLLVQLARSEESVGSRSRWDIFWDSVSRLFAGAELGLPVRKLPNTRIGADATSDRDYVRVTELTRGSELRRLQAFARVKVDSTPVKLVGDRAVPLSSGQVTFLSFAAQVCLHIENASLVLVDEPETHLHPNLISSMVELFDAVLRMTGSCAVIATHSAYLVREVPKTQVHVFHELEPGIVQIVPPRLKTFAAEIGAISAFVFSDDFAERLVQRVTKQLSRRRVNSSNALNMLKDELPSEALMAVKDRLGNKR